MEAGRAAFVVPHPYVDALACFREPIKRLADEGWQVDLFTTLSPQHPAPAFNRENVRLVPIEMTRIGVVRLVAQLVWNRPKYDWLFAVPQWSLHYTGVAASMANIPMVCISDELKAEAEASSDELRRWKQKERRAHQKCAFTIALSDPRAAFIRDEDRLGPTHPIVTVPNAAPGPARRLISHYYQDTLDIPCDKRIVLHAGSWWWKLQFAEIENVARGWGDSNVLVFQGRMQNPFPEAAAHPNLRFHATVLPSDLLDYAVSSAHIGLALYDTRIANNRLMGTASGKVMLYMKNALPVITLTHPSFEWIEREGCGVLVKDLRDVGGAVDRIQRDYDGYVRNVKCFYDEALDFGKRFDAVQAMLRGHHACH